MPRRRLPKLDTGRRMDGVAARALYMQNIVIILPNNTSRSRPNVVPARLSRRRPSAAATDDVARQGKWTSVARGMLAATQSLRAAGVVLYALQKQRWRCTLGPPAR